MAWIKTISEEEAEGSVKRQYSAALKRAGRVYNVVKISSLKPDIMRTFIQLYLQLMHGPSSLSRAQREMIAVVVSKTNHCHY
ncbi:MAG: carboxymuconolactone decarboxylase family protein [bacterium]